MIGFWQEMSFRQPLWLWLAVQPILFMLLARLLSRVRHDAYADAQLLPWVRVQSRAGSLQQLLRMGLLLIAWLLLAIAMAGPRLPQTLPEQQSTTQRELMVLLDVSPSMTARDVQPTRLQRARLELLDLINRMQGTRMGIIVYGASAHLLSPLTHDKAVLRHYVNAIQARQLPTLGSRLQGALALATQQFPAQADQARALLLISDGELHLDQAQQTRLEDSIRRLTQNHIRLYALGVGTGYGAPVMAEDQGWLQYAGETVNSRLQSQQLQALAQLGQGRYSEIRDSNQDWQSLYDEGIGRLTPLRQTATTEQIIWHDHYHGFLIAGVFCLLLGLWQPRRNTRGISALLVLLVLLNPGFVPNSHAGDNYQTAYQYLQNRDYARAKQLFSGMAGYAARLGEGNAAYHLQQFNIAAQQFTQALLDASNDQQRGLALFNLANCRYQLNDYVAAATLYEDVLAYLPDHTGARTNLGYARALQREETKSGRVAHRAGRGAQTGQAPEGMSTEGVRGISLGDDADKARVILPADNITAQTGTPRQTLQQTRAASGKVDKDSDSQWQYRIHTLQQLQQQNPRIESDSTVFWQRLFEQEEGFMAPVEQAHRLPEVKPW